MSSKLDGQALPAISMLADELKQLSGMQAATTRLLETEAASTRGQLAQMKQWFDANQVSSRLIMSA